MWKVYVSQKSNNKGLRFRTILAIIDNVEVKLSYADESVCERLSVISIFANAFLHLYIDLEYTLKFLHSRIS